MATIKTLSCDLETYSSADLTKCGVYRYAESPDFEILLFAYRADGSPVRVVDLACGERIPEEVLDALTDEREIDRLARQVEDRFGPLPLEVQNLLFVVKIRNLGGEMGFEKIIIKNGMQIMFFVNNPMSAYYKSKRFETILSRVNENPTLFKFNQDGGKLRTVSRGVNTLSSALHILKKLQ